MTVKLLFKPDFSKKPKLPLSQFRHGAPSRKKATPRKPVFYLPFSDKMSLPYAQRRARKEYLRKTGQSGFRRSPFLDSLGSGALSLGASALGAAAAYGGEFARAAYSRFAQPKQQIILSELQKQALREKLAASKAQNQPPEVG
jgi:hypothetical protein